MERVNLYKRIKELYGEIKRHIESVGLRDDTINICGQIWFNELEVSERVDIMIDIKPSKIKNNMLHSCLDKLINIVEEEELDIIY